MENNTRTPIEEYKIKKRLANAFIFLGMSVALCGIPIAKKENPYYNENSVKNHINARNSLSKIEEISLNQNNINFIPEGFENYNIVRKDEAAKKQLEDLKEAYKKEISTLENLPEVKKYEKFSKNKIYLSFSLLLAGAVLAQYGLSKRKQARIYKRRYGICRRSE